MFKSYKFIIKKPIFLALLLVLFQSGTSWAGLWYKIYENPTFGKINAAAHDPDFQNIFAVGDDGMYYHAFKGGYDWEEPIQLTSNKLNSIAVYWDQYGEGTFKLIAAGNNGTALRFDSGSGSWVSIDSLTSDNFNIASAISNEGYTELWLGGDKGQLFNSYDQGQTWRDVSLPDNDLSVKLINLFNYTTYLIAVKNDSSFLYDIYEQVVYDTLAHTDLFKSVAIDSEGATKIYYLGRDTQTGENSIWRLKAGNNSRFSLLYHGDFGGATDIGGYNRIFGAVHGNTVKKNAGNYNAKLWVSSADGRIWESVDFGKKWKEVFKTSQPLELGPLLGNSSAHDFGRAFGEGGLVLKYGFDLLYTNIGSNANLPANFSDLELHFSAQPDLESINKEMSIYSRLRGYLPFSTEADMNDSNLVYVHISPFHPGFIPGDQINFSFGPFIRPVEYDSTDYFTAFNRDVFIISPNQSSFDFNMNSYFESINKPTSNFITALLDRDDWLDLAAVAGDSLFVYSSSTGQAPQTARRVYLSDLPSAPQHLLTTDINNDGLPDLLVYDNANMHIFTNVSHDSVLEFTEEAEPFFDQTTIKQVAMYNGNNNNIPDMVLYDAQMNSRMDVEASNFGDYVTEINPEPESYQHFELGDLDNDRTVDMALLGYSGYLTFWQGMGYGSFNYWNAFSSADKGYTKIRLADLDDDGALEVLAQKRNVIDIYKKNLNEWGWSFEKSGAAIVCRDSIIDFAVQKLGGDHSPEMDICVITADSLKFFDNQSASVGEFNFTEEKDAGRRLGIGANQIVIADMDHNGMPDVAVLNTNTGQMELWTKMLWKPEIQNYFGQKHHIHLEWSSLPSDMGTLDYYILYRDNLPGISEQSWQQIVNDPFYDDYDINEISSYWYAVKAVYNGGQESELSDPVYIENFIILNDTLTADLDDTTRYYIVESRIIVPPGGTRTISPGVCLLFKPGTGLDVYGNLNVHGNPFGDDQMIEFNSPGEENNRYWDGIYIYPAADTVNWDWFSVNNSQNGMVINSRPAHLRYCAFMQNEKGLYIRNDSLSLHNMVFDSNMVALQLAGNVHADIRNIDLFHSETGISAADHSKGKIRNAIIWDNLNSVALNGENAQLSLRYSTVDSLNADVPKAHISKLPPVFMPSDSGDFRPDYLSPTIDAGDPNDDYSQEPLPNGGRINQGVFGGIFWATPSYQPRLHVSPKNILLSAYPGAQDTIDFYIKNPGTINLEIPSFDWQRSDTVFQISTAAPIIISGGDSLAVRLLFKPTVRMHYSDTLMIWANDPHLEKGFVAVAVQGEGLNSAPVVVNEPIRVGKVGQLYQYQIAVSDADGDSIIFTAQQLPNWLRVSATGLVSGTPTEADKGINNVRILISDGYGGSDTLNYRIVVSQKVFISIPVVQVSALRDTLIREAAVHFRFTVQDSAPQSASPVRIHYLLRRIAEAQPLSEVDTIGIHSAEFYPLKDGAYLFKIWAYRSGETDSSRIKAAKVFFRVAASQRSVLPLRWYMVSFPRPQEMQWSHFGYPDSAAKLYQWNSDQNDYLPVMLDHITPARSFWMLTFKPLSFDLNEFPDAYSEGQASVTLEKGWNQIGIPVGYGIAWKDMMFIDSTGESIPLLKAVQDSLVEGFVYWFVQSTGEPGYQLAEIDSTTLAQPWRGYWLKADKAGQLHFPSKPSFSATSINPVAKPMAAATFDEWQLNISLKNSKYQDSKNIIGISRKKKRTIFEPPHFGDFCALYFPSAKGKITRQFKKPFKAQDEVKSWDLRLVTNKPNIDHQLSWSAQENRNSEVYLYLVDEVNEKIIKMNEENTYTFRPQSHEMRFKIFASEDESFRPEIIPLQYKLLQNYPNPFNPGTTIRFGLPESASGKKVELSIFNILGKKVRTLLNGAMKAGYHEVSWDGKNDQQRQVASGIYFYQIHSASFYKIKKMILVR